jgi:hypothetical protein
MRIGRTRVKKPSQKKEGWVLLLLSYGGCGGNEAKVLDLN